MASEQKRWSTYTWVTWLTAPLAGMAQCHWAPWYKAHFNYRKHDGDTFDLAAWAANHTVLLNTRAARLRGDGWAVSLENANAMKVQGKATMLSGKPDIIATTEHRVLVSDAKTGQQSNKDFWQVLLYLFAWPLAFPDKINGRTLSGEIVYKDQRVVPVGIEMLTPDRRNEIIAMLQLVGGDQEPQRVPSEFECARCDVAACPDRFTEKEAVPLLTSEF